MMAYNFTALSEGTNFVDWAVVINSWTNGTLFAGLIIIGSLITFMISYKASGDDTPVALITSGFIWALIASLLWTIQFNGATLMPTVIPVLYGIILGVGALLKTLRGGVGNV
jgi:hypothetical protein